MTERYNITIEISDVDTEKFRLLETEVWRIRRMVLLMLDTCDEDTVFMHGPVATSIKAVKE